MRNIVIVCDRIILNERCSVNNIIMRGGVCMSMWNPAGILLFTLIIAALIGILFIVIKQLKKK